MGDAERGGWGTARWVALAAGVFLLWRGLFARRAGGAVPLALGALSLRRALRSGARPARAVRVRGSAVEVVEGKSPAELARREAEARREGAARGRE
jgi:hypothetical protein